MRKCFTNQKSILKLNNDFLPFLLGGKTMKKNFYFTFVLSLFLTFLSYITIAQTINYDQYVTLIGHTGSVTSLAFTPDGKILASGSYDKTIKLWDVMTEKEIRTLPGHSASVMSVSISKDGKIVASGSVYGEIILWDISTGEKIKTLKGHSYSVNSLAFSPDGKTLASGSMDMTIKLWNVTTGMKILALTGHLSSIKSVCFNSDGKILASGSSDRTIKLWDIETGKKIKTLLGHSGSINSIDFSPDGKILASGGYDSTIKFWDDKAGEIIKNLTGHRDIVTSISFSPDGKIIASGSEDKSIKLWNVETGKEIKTLCGHSDFVLSVAFSPDGKTLASSSSDKTIKIWDITKYISDSALYIKQKELPKINVFSSFIGLENNYLNAGESGKIVVTLNNVGKIDVNKLQFNVSSQMDISGITFGKIPIIDILPVGKSKTIEITISADSSVQSKEVKLKIDVTGADRFRVDTSAVITFNTRSLRKFEPVSLKETVKKETITDSTFAQKPQIIPEKANEQIKSFTKLDTIPPKITVLEPSSLRGNKISTKAKDISIKGKVTDESGIYEVSINGEDARIRQSGEFSVEVKLAVGLNIVTIIAKDTKDNKSVENIVVFHETENIIERKGEDYAVFFAIDKYDYWNSLTNPINDAQTIADEIKNNYGFKTEIIKNPNFESIYSSLRKYAERQYSDGDQLFIFFAGHGSFDEVTKEGFVVTKNSRKDDISKTTYISHARLRQIIDNILCKHIFLVMDVCYAGTFDPLIAQLDRSEDEYSEVTKTEFINRKLKFKTRRFLTSGGKEYVPDGRPGMHSPFARKFLEALRSYGGKDGILTFGEIINYVEKVKPEPRTGEFGTNEPGSDFIFIAR
jgi:WD40 repeat protein